MSILEATNQAKKVNEVLSVHLPHLTCVVRSNMKVNTLVIRELYVHDSSNQLKIV